jgi:3-deoxy-D-manno-octulosonic-acid transferase
VIEPAAFGAPVLFGSRHGASRDAAMLIERGGGFSVSSANEIETSVVALFADSAARRAAGDQARALVESGLGAAERSVALVERLLGKER